MMSFQAGCIWADESRRDTFKDTYEYHYINVSKRVFRAAMMAGPAKRIGDLHQPLHVGFAEDLGGNRIDVKWDTGHSTIPDVILPTVP
jgi:S1/P1 Nuclease